ncbi:MAG: agmatine deiminase family protein [Bacteroidota bacterium]
MIKDSETNIVYFSKLIENYYPKEINKITDILEKHGFEYGFLTGTNDIWCRDYMPVQKDVNSFVQFKFDPSYLKKYPEYLSYPKEVCSLNNFTPEFCDDINLDGGNVIKWDNKVIVTERIFKENNKYDQSQLIKDLEKILEVQVIIIPDITKDETGHADGHVRFYDNNTILVNKLDQEYLYWQDGFRKMIKKYGFKIIEVPWFTHYDKKHGRTAIGCYMNFLEIGNLIILPIFEVKGNKDQEVFDLFASIYPNKIIETININSIGKHGGLMNCITWNILK